MSRIGRQSIVIKEGVKVDVSKGNAVTVTGPKGVLHLQVPPNLILSQESGEFSVSRPTDQKRHRAMHGLYRSLLANMVTGVNKGFTKRLEIIGVGTRAEVKLSLIHI